MKSQSSPAVLFNTQMYGLAVFLIKCGLYLNIKYFNAINSVVETIAMNFLRQ